MSHPDDRDLKLTLRTLLAWLDDQLSASDVRQIGQKAAESDVAQGLIKRIRKVTRRRRLTVPTASGPDGTDPNLVASYLDNELVSEKVAEYEEKCLRSDLDLAEVASCHQILSMIEQRAKVPSEARYRMYRLVKGREAIARDAKRGRTTILNEPTAKPIPLWTPPGGARRRSWIDRFGPPVAALLMLLVMGFSARMMIPAPEELVIANPTPRASGAAGPGRGEELERADLAKRDPRLAGTDPSLLPDESQVVGIAEPDTTADATVESPSEIPGTGAILGSGLGTIEDLAGGVLLRWNPDEGVWLSLKQGDSLESEDRLVAPAPFQPILRVGSTRIRLIGPAEIQLLEPAEGESTRLALADGRLVLRPSDPALVTLLLENQAVQLTLPAGSAVGVDRSENWPAGAESPSAPSLYLSTAENQVGLRAGNVAETLAGPGSVTFRVPARFTDATPGGVPDWVTNEDPDEVELLTGTEFASYFTPGSSTTRALVEAVEDETSAVRDYAVSTLGVLGGVDLVAAALARSGDPDTRLAAIRALRKYGARSPLSARELGQKLAEFNGETWAALVVELLAGTAPEKARQRQTYVDLVSLLEHPDLGIRSLALDQLMHLTGRDSLQYDPDRPMGPGLDAWKSLLRSGEIQPRGGLEADESGAAAPTTP